jgi:PAS domain S-box-containing protein
MVKQMNDSALIQPSATVNAGIDAIDKLPLPYIEMDTEGFITRANHATLALHPLEHGDLIGKMVWDLMATDEKEPGCAAYISLMESGEDPPVVRRSLYTRSGEFRVYDLHRSLKRDAEGRPAGMRMICVDVTEARKALDEEHSARVWLESTIDSLADAVIVTDAMGFIRAVNPAAEALFGWKAPEVIDKMIEKGMRRVSFVSGDKTALDFNMALDGHRKGIVTIHDREHREVRVEITSSPIVDKASGFTSGVVSVLRVVRDAGLA